MSSEEKDGGDMSRFEYLESLISQMSRTLSIRDTRRDHVADFILKTDEVWEVMAEDVILSLEEIKLSDIPPGEVTDLTSKMVDAVFNIDTAIKVAIKNYTRLVFLANSVHAKEGTRDEILD